MSYSIALEPDAMHLVSLVLTLSKESISLGWRSFLRNRTSITSEPAVKNECSMYRVFTVHLELTLAILDFVSRPSFRLPASRPNQPLVCVKLHELV